MEKSSAADKIRILIIVARLNVGGPAIQVLNLTREFNSGPFESLLIHGRLAPFEADMTELPGMDVKERQSLPELGRELNPVKDIVTVLKLVGIIRKYKPQIVHTHTAKAGAAGRFAAWLCGVPVIVHTYHGHVFHGYFSPLKTRLFIMIEKFLAGVTTKIITLSDLQKNEICGILKIPSEKAAVIPFGFDLERFGSCRESCAGEFRKSIGAGPDTRIVSIVGRITAIKNHALFLEAARICTDRVNNVLFVIVGDGEERAECEARAKELGITDRVVFAGWRKEVEKVYADSDITVLTSDNEGTPVCLIESLSAGVPVVATNVGGVADVVDDGISGFLAPPADAEALAGHILKLLADPGLRERMGKARQRKILDSYSGKRFVSRIGELYLELLKEKSRWNGGS
jgi:glycosyltransferase involved in cell wall biosynthesis